MSKRDINAASGKSLKETKGIILKGCQVQIYFKCENLRPLINTQNEVTAHLPPRIYHFFWQVVYVFPTMIKVQRSHDTHNTKYNSYS